ncbi:adenosylhomocysteinase [Pyrobaculum aerophilum str. IM2]|uniref:Adenosylhomocysteinase n=2 Tax=Pyrobaculum aerophilum TaxID=13773 RepID=SAHH_PYRAE|nr:MULTISPECIES: adenosylhomocysteinase [Pyrobaculum]Q8ZTQ7.1 RecName: Full=Adenosylhomocysteinase; AltName: Full=S-adenosyl-L-homocysteine hydrolase; Short=AdoHcyase [Pyrobaculum aerophilum str. IM2]AAL64702.1 adenosylhomocysteinase [Pyrobaculum aerophilum str. IM2]HII46221.1 adenosylhomocysteinase [Pyrobaculum aerophilum]
MPESRVKDSSLADRGREQLYWAELNMPVLLEIRRRFEKEKPLSGHVIAACLHVTKETGVLVRTLAAGGAEVVLIPSNPLSTQDDVAAALAQEGIHVYAWRGMSEREYYNAIGFALSFNPTITMDDGADLTATIHKIGHGVRDQTIEYVLETAGSLDAAGLFSRIRGGTEETTTGVIRLKALKKSGKLLYPIIAVNESYTKYLFDNRYGTGQSTWDGVMRATNLLIAGKNVVIAGYGWVGRGIAIRARGLGARRVIVVEVDPIRALEAVFDGYEVMPMDKAAEVGDIFITATGNIRAISLGHIFKMKDGAVLANAGHFNVEIDVAGLERVAVAKRRIRPYLEEYTLPNGKRVYLIGEGRLVNLVAAEGHPSEVMDLSFANQALAAEFLAKNKLSVDVYKLPDEIDREVARLKLKTMGIEIEELTEEQRRYISSWELGT